MEENQNSQQVADEAAPSADAPQENPSNGTESTSEQSQSALQTSSETGTKPSRNIDSRVAGLCFIILGAAIFTAQFYGFRLGHYIWPMFILLPGVLLFLASLRVEGGLGESFAIVGSIISMLGLMFFGMSISGMWASWAYAWALLFPTSIGIGQILYGRYKDQPNLIKTGISLVKVGISIFLVGFLFFEGLLNISDLHFGMYALPVFFIVVGIFLLLRTMKKK
jgi:hypothetical protein